MSSGPAFLPNASSTAARAAAHPGLRSPSARPAPRKVIPSRNHRSSNPSSESSGDTHRSYISCAKPPRAARPAPPRAAPARISSASARCASGSRSVQSQICRAHDLDNSPPASAAAITGCDANRRAQATAAAAAPCVTWVCHLSHARALPWPSSSNPPCPANAVSTRARAAVCLASARSSARSASAWATAGNDATSAVPRYARERSSMPSASATPAGSSAHMPVTSHPLTAPQLLIEI